MLPALAEIVSNVVGLQLDSNITAAVLGAVLAPLLRSGPCVDPALEEPTRIRRKRVGRKRLKSRSVPRRKRKYKRHAPTEARDRALAALRAKPGATLTEIAKVAKVSIAAGGDDAEVGARLSGGAVEPARLSDRDRRAASSSGVYS